MAFNKMFVMLPVMFAARKLDGEDPMVVNYLRIAYGVVQVLCVIAVLTTYLRASKAASQYTNLIVYVPPPPTVRSYCTVQSCTLLVVPFFALVSLLPCIDLEV